MSGKKRVLVTGAGGFIGSNLVLHLSRRDDLLVLPVRRSEGLEALEAAVARLEAGDVVVHLAGVNRPGDESEFAIGNADLTALLCERLAATGKAPTLVLSSSTQAGRDNPYGRSKRGAEQAALGYGARTGARVRIYRLPNVFGKWARPNYNSAVATFCHNVANGLPITIHDPSALLRLVYVDDLVADWMDVVDGNEPAVDADGFCQLFRTHETSVGEVADRIRAIHASRGTRITEPVGDGLWRALHATYLSHLRPDQFSYPLTAHTDPRGTFAEIVKTRNSGQVSVFTAHPGVTRGGHYHHSKTEKFLVVAGTALYRFRHMVTGETAELTASGERLEIVETVPGWTHDITNVGTTEMIVVLWANELFDPLHPDTYMEPLA